MSAPVQDPSVEQAELEGGKLPIDIRALVIGILLRWSLIGGAVLLSLPVAFVVSIFFSDQEYRSETVMMFSPPPTLETEERPTPSLFTQISLIKVRSNLERVKERLKLDASSKTIGAAIDVTLENKTTLISLRVKWPNPKEAADIANTVREIFFESQENMIRGGSLEKIEKLEKSIATVTAELVMAEETLNKFTNTNQVVDLTQQIQWSLEEQTSINLLLEEAMVEQVTVNQKMSNIERIISELEERVQKEKAESAASSDALSEIGIRLERLQDSIRTDKENRSNSVLLEEAQRQYERATELHKEGAISEQELQSAKARYEERKVWGQDTEQIVEWKDEIKKLDEVVIPKDGAVTASGKLLQDVLFEKFKLELDQVATAERVESYQKAKAKIQERLQTLPDLQRKFVELSRNIEIKALAKKDFEADLSTERRFYDATASPFITIVEAVPPSSPSSSNKKTVFLLVVMMISGVSVAVVVLRVLLDITIKTEYEAEVRLSLPCLSGFPDVANAKPLLPNGMTPQFIETFRILARTLRARTPKKGGRLMFVSSGHDEGTTFLAANVAAIFGRTDENVLIIDAQVRPVTPQRVTIKPKRFNLMHRCLHFWSSGIRYTPQSNRLELHDLLHEAERAKPAESELGLGDFLSFKAATIDEIVRTTRLPNVDCIPRFGTAVVPDMLGTKRMKELLEEASNRYTLIIVDAPPVLHYVDAEALSGLVDGVVFVVRANHGYFPALKSVLNRLNAQGVPIIGTIVNRIQPAYMNRTVEVESHENLDR